MQESFEIDNQRFKSLRKVNDQTVLAMVALEDAEGYIRVHAASRLTDQTLLAKVATEGDAHVRVAAIKKLTDQTMLAGFSMEGEAKVRIAATSGWGSNRVRWGSDR